MIKLLAYLFVLMPFMAFAQLLPEIPSIQGNVKKITEKRFGKEIAGKKTTAGILRPKANSGLRYIYFFDEQSNLEKRLGKQNGRLISDYRYHRDTLTDRTIVTETHHAAPSESTDRDLQYENYADEGGHRIKTNLWAFNPESKKWEIIQVEQNATYQSGRLTSFIRYQTNETGNFSPGEQFDFRYDGLARIDQIERQDLASGFKTVFQYRYNREGLVDQASIDFLTDLQEYKKSQLQEISYKYDRRGNWIRKYLKSGDLVVPVAKRKIRYY